MRIRALDTSGDWQFGRGKSSYYPDDKAVMQNLASRIRSWVGDCFFDVNMGIDWANRLDKNQKDNLINDLKYLIMQTQEVVAVKSVTANFDPITRHLVVAYNVDTIYSSSFQALVNISAGV